MTDYKRVALRPETILELSRAKAKMLAENPSESTITADDAIREALKRYNDVETS